MQILVTAVGSFIIGLLGAILGIGGGTFLVPFLVLLTPVRPVEAVGISLFCVIGTSIGGASKALASGQANLKLALSIEPFMLIGSVGASIVAHKISDSSLLVAFAVMMLGIGGLFLYRTSIKSVAFTTPEGEPRFLDGEVLEPGGETIHYRPQRFPILAMLVASTGAASGLFGIGGGTLNVPYLTMLAKVPMRAAASTSVLTMAVTGAAAGAVHLAQGTVPGTLVAASLVAVIPGARLGARLQRHLPERGLRGLFAALAFIVAGATFARAWGWL